jgi:hypothetical protein
LTLKNLALYPSNFKTTAPSDTTIYWANVNFQEFGFANQRVWQFNAAGITNQNSTTITTPYNISFEGPLSDWLTTSLDGNVINASDAMKISAILDQDKTIFDIFITRDEPLGIFSFSLLQKDKCTCAHALVILQCQLNNLI